MPKNYNLQPEPALGQVLGLPNVRGYNFDVQIVDRAGHRWIALILSPGRGRHLGESGQGHVSERHREPAGRLFEVMPFLVKALLDNRRATNGRLPS